MIVLVTTPEQDASPALEPLLDDPLLDDPVAQRRAAVLSVTGLAVSILIAVLTVMPAAFAIGGPGPTFDTLGEKDGVPLVQISGAPTYDSTGELRLLTVSVSDASDTPFTMGRVLAGWVSPKEYVVPREFVFGTPEQADQVSQQAQTDWISSQESATVAALEELGQPVPAVISVAAVPEGSKA